MLAPLRDSPTGLACGRPHHLPMRHQADTVIARGRQVLEMPAPAVGGVDFVNMTIVMSQDPNATSAQSVRTLHNRRCRGCRGGASERACAASGPLWRALALHAARRAHLGAVAAGRPMRLMLRQSARCPAAAGGCAR